MKFIKSLIMMAILCLAPCLVIGQTATLISIADSYVSVDIPTQNFGDEQLVAIGPYNDILGFIRFNLSSIPSDAIIDFAELRLYATTVNDNESVVISRISTSWSESGVTWNNRPGGTLPVISSSPPGSFEWWEINVKPIVDEWISGGEPNYGFHFESNSGLVMVGSREYTKKPELVISYTVPNAKPTIDVTQPSSNVTVTQGESVLISWNGTDPDDDAVVTLFYDTDCDPNNGNWHLIGGTSFSEDGSYYWNTSEVELGVYRVYACIDDGNHGIDIDYDCASGSVTITDMGEPNIRVEPTSMTIHESCPSVEGNIIEAKYARPQKQLPDLSVFHAPNRLIVQLDPDLALSPSSQAGMAVTHCPEVDVVLQKYGVTSVSNLFRSNQQSRLLRNTLLINFEEATTDLEQLIKDLLMMDDVWYVEPDNIHYAVGIPDDPRYSSQWALPKISMPEAWGSTGSTLTYQARSGRTVVKSLKMA